MAKYYTSVASSSAAVDWTDLFASGQVLNGKDVSSVVVRAGTATRFESGSTDPVASTTAGQAVAAGNPATFVFDDDATKNLWVQSPASRARVSVEVDTMSEGPTFIVT